MCYAHPITKNNIANYIHIIQVHFFDKIKKLDADRQVLWDLIGESIHCEQQKHFEEVCTSSQVVLLKKKWTLWPTLNQFGVLLIDAPTRNLCRDIAALTKR